MFSVLRAILIIAGIFYLSPVRQADGTASRLDDLVAATLGAHRDGRSALGAVEPGALLRSLPSPTGPIWRDRLAAAQGLLPRRPAANPLRPATDTLRPEDRAPQWRGQPPLRP